MQYFNINQKLQQASCCPHKICFAMISFGWSSKCAYTYSGLHNFFHNIENVIQDSLWNESYKEIADNWIRVYFLDLTVFSWHKYSQRRQRACCQKYVLLWMPKICLYWLSEWVYFIDFTVFSWHKCSRRRRRACCRASSQAAPRPTCPRWSAAGRSCCSRWRSRWSLRTRPQCSKRSNLRVSQLSTTRWMPACRQL